MSNIDVIISYKGIDSPLFRGELQAIPRLGEKVSVRITEYEWKRGVVKSIVWSMVKDDDTGATVEITLEEK